MRKLPAFAFAGVAAALAAGTAFAAAPKTHVINVPLGDGSSVRVEYVGDVAPKVTVAPGPMSNAAAPWAMPFPAFGGFDRIMADMQRQSQEMMLRARQMARQPAGAAPYIAGYSNLPAGGTSETIISVSNNGSTCTRTTQVVSQGPGKPPKVTSTANGQCGEEKAAGPGAHPA